MRLHRTLAILATLPIAPQVWPAEPQFEVASIKQNVSPDRNSTFRFAPGGRLTGENVNPEFLIMTAYHLRDFQISGAPGWFDSDKYDIAAKGEGNPTQDQLIAMLRGLLADRFKLKFHWVTKQLPVYVLVPAKSGIKLQESKEGSCLVAAPGQTAEAKPFCGTYFFHRSQIDGNRIDMGQFIAALGFQIDRPIINRTGFGKTFDVHLAWTPEETGADGPTDLPGPSIFTALQEQTGLKLESQKGPVPILAIDHIEKPGEN